MRFVSCIGFLFGDLVNVSRTEKTKDTFVTPDNILARARRIDSIGFDPATNIHNPTRARAFCSLLIPMDKRWAGPDGLAMPWAPFSPLGLLWLNPPFGNKHPFIRRMVEAAAHGLMNGILLIPAAVGANWWQNNCSPRLSIARAACYLSQRVLFIDPDTGMTPVDKHGKPAPAMFDTALVYYGQEPEKFASAFKDMGDVDFPA